MVRSKSNPRKRDFYPNRDFSYVSKKSKYFPKSSKTKAQSAASDKKVVRQFWSASYNDQEITAGSLWSGVITCNDITTTDQPMGRDQMFTLFEKAYVKNFKFQAAIGNNTSSSQLTACMWIDDHNTTSSTKAQSIQRAKSHNGMVKDRFYGSSIGPGGLYLSVSGNSFNELKSGFNEPDNWCTATTGPTNKYYAHIEIWNGSTALPATAAGLQVEFKSEYEVIYFDPVELATS